MAQAVKNPKPTLAGVAKAGGTAAAVAIAANAVLYLIGSAVGAFPPDALTPMGVPVDVTAVIGASVMGSLAGTIGYFILTRVLALKLARQVFTGGVVLALIGMFFTPFGIPNAPVLQIILLEIMHVVVGGALWYFLAKG